MFLCKMLGMGINMEGQILGNRYLLLEKIGGGGMAVVYKAKCTFLNRFVAIKMLRSEFTNDEEFVKRFKVEAQAVASLSHPNVVSIYDVGHHDDMHYIVMEYVDGMTLKEFINKHGAINWQDAVKITIQICSAIEHAHKNNIVHRDIKPHNILLTKEGIAKVTDFGIARAVTSSTITMVGSTIGSVHYFSPEQARGGFIDEKSDLYSLGIALYEMVTGRVPFDGDTPVSVALKHIQEMPIEPHKITPNLPYGVNEIIMKAIQKEQNMRYQSATAMLNDLNRVLTQPQGGFVGQEVSSSQSTIRMKSINDANGANAQRYNNPNKNKAEATKQKKKNNVAYWLAGITSIIVIGVALVITAILLTRNNEADINKYEDYTGKQIEVVRPQLEEKGFKVIVTPQESENVPTGIIISQKPDAETPYKDPKFEKIEFVVSSGSKLIPVPDVKDREYREAENEIEAKSLVPKVEREFNEEVPKDYVIRTEPAADEKLAEGSEVKIIVSDGKKTTKRSVPNLVGRTKIEAEKLLSDNKLVLGNVVPIGATDGIVTRQAPEAYEEVAEGEGVTIWLSPQETTPSNTTQGQSPSTDTTQGNQGTQETNNNGDTNNPADTSQPADNSTGNGDTAVKPENETK